MKSFGFCGKFFEKSSIQIWDVGPLGSSLVLLLVSSLDDVGQGSSSLSRLQFLHLKMCSIKKSTAEGLRIRFSLGRLAEDLSLDIVSQIALRDWLKEVREEPEYISSNKEKDS